MQNITDEIIALYQKEKAEREKWLEENKDIEETITYASIKLGAAICDVGIVMAKAFNEATERINNAFARGVVVPSAVDKIKTARHYALRVREIAEVHVTFDFLYRLQACADYYSVAPVFDTKMIAHSEPLPILGRPCIVHEEPCNKEFWFVGEDGKEISYTLPP